MSLICRTVSPIVFISLSMIRSQNILSSFTVIVLYYFRYTMPFSTEPLKRRGDGRKTEMHLRSLKTFAFPLRNVEFVCKPLHSPDKLCVCLQNVYGGKNCMNTVVLQEIVKFLGRM